MIRRARADETDKTFDAKSDTSKTVSGSRIRFHFPGFDTIIFPLKRSSKGNAANLGFQNMGRVIFHHISYLVLKFRNNGIIWIMVD